MVATSPSKSIADWLGKDADDLLSYQAKVDKSQLHLPGPDWVNRIFSQSDRSPQVLRSLQQLYGTGRLANTGYLSILPSPTPLHRQAQPQRAAELPGRFRKSAKPLPEPMS